MAKQTVSIGSSANDGTGDPLRTAFDKINDNFDELYGTTAEANDLIEDATPQLGGDLDINGFNITSARTNEDIKILPAGTGGVLASAVRLQGTTISSDDSSQITIGEAFQVNGATNMDGAVTATSTVGVTGAFTGTSGAFSTTLAVTGATTLTGALTVNDSVTATSLTTNDIASNGSNADITLDTAGTGDINLTAGADINIPANIGLTFGDDGEKIEGDGTDLTIAGNNINLTAVADVVIPTNVGLHFTDANEKIESDGTDLTINSGADINLTATADVNLPSNIGLVFGDDGEKIEGDGTNLLISSSGTATITATGSTVITNAATISGTLTAAAITATGAVSITGATTVAGLLTATSLTANDITSNGSNADLDINPQGTGAILLTGPITATGVQTTTGQLNVDNLRIDGNALTATNTDGGITITPNGTGGITLGGEIVGVTNELNATDIEVSGVLRSNTIQSDTTDADINISSQGTGVVGISSQLTLTGSFLPAIHTFVATDAVTIAEHAGRTLLLGEVGGNAAVTLTLPDATGSGATYKFIVSVTNTSNYVIAVPDANNTIDGVMLYLDEDGTAVTAFPTVAASDTITLNGTTTGGVLGDYLEIVDIAADQYHVRGVMRVPAGSNPVTPFSAAV
jgi:hypothetical protein